MNPLKQQVIDKVESSVLLAREQGLILPHIEVRFDLTKLNWAACATVTSSKTGIIRINEHYLYNYTEQFIKQTVPHEVCHVIADYTHGVKGYGHGRYWRKYMKEVYRLFPYPNNVYGVEKIWTVEPDF